MKRLNKTSDLHPFNVQYGLFDTENTGTNLNAKTYLAYVKYFFFPDGETNKRGERNKWCTFLKKKAIYSDRFTYFETL